MWEGAQNLHILRVSLPLDSCMLINLESFQTPSFWGFLEALLFFVCLVTESGLTLLQPHGLYSPSGSSVDEIFH